MEFWDDYEHRDPKLTYICENIKTKEVEDSVEDGLMGCECRDTCSTVSCSCFNRSGAQYLFPDRTALQDYTLQISNLYKPLYECNNNCKCADVLCGNKLVQYGPRKGLQIIDTGFRGKGLGLVTDNTIKAGTFICEYAGEVITQAEALQRYKTYAKQSNNYIFCINESFGDNSKKTFIDPTFYGNIGRYINHSCEPNSILVPIRINDVIPKLCVFAKESISQNTEITFDYGQTNSNLGGKKCLCLSVNCRKFLPFDESLTDDL